MGVGDVKKSADMRDVGRPRAAMVSYPGPDLSWTAAPPGEGGRGLIERLLRDRRETMKKIYWSHVRSVEGWVREGFRSEVEASLPRIGVDELEHLVQEIFARAFRDNERRSLDDRRGWAASLFGIARSVVEAYKSKRAPHRKDGESEGRVEAYLRTLLPELAAVHHERYVLCHTERDAARWLGLSRHELRKREDQLREGLDRVLRAPRGE